MATGRKSSAARPAKPTERQGLSERRIRELAEQIRERADAERQGGTQVYDFDLDAWAREMLRDEVLPEFLTIEAERVLAAVWAS